MYKYLLYKLGVKIYQNIISYNLKKEKSTKGQENKLLNPIVTTILTAFKRLLDS